MRSLGVLLALSCAGCLSFSDQLERCRADGGWRCPVTSTDAGFDGGVGGGAADAGRDAGEEDGGVEPPDAGPVDAGDVDGGPAPARLICQAGYCWEYPRSSNQNMLAIGGASLDDYWAAWGGARRSVIAHWVDGGWSDTQEMTGRISGLCTHPTGRLLSVDRAAGPWLYALDGGAWQPALQVAPGPVDGIFCGAARLYATTSDPSSAALSSFSYGDATPMQLSALPVAADCGRVTEFRDAPVVWCADGAGASIRRPMEVVEYGVVGALTGPLWVDPVQGLLAATRSAQPMVYRWVDAGHWDPLFLPALGVNDLYAAAAYDKGSVAVGQYGSVIDVSGVIRPEQISVDENNYAFAVMVVPDGGAIAGLESGCVVQRAGGVWSETSSCAMEIKAVAPGSPAFAVGGDNGKATDALLRREANAWVEVRRGDRGTFIDVGVDRDGGPLILGTDRFWKDGLESAVGLFSGAEEWAVIDADNFVVRLDNGSVYHRLSGTQQPAPLLFGVTRVDVDRATQTWFASTREQKLFSSAPGGGWDVERQFDAGITDFAVFGGERWVLTPDRLWHRAGQGTWASIELATTAEAEARLVPRSPGVVEVHPPHTAPRRYFASAPAASQPLEDHADLFQIRRVVPHASGNWIVTNDDALVWQPREEPQP